MSCATLTERKLIAVTLRRPWAGLVALGLCPVISLPTAPSYLWGDYVAVHAGLGEDAQAGERLARAGLNPHLPEQLSHAAGAVMAVARAVRLEELHSGLAAAYSPLARGPVLLWVDSPLRIAPVPAVGQGAAWVPTEALAAQLRRAYAAARAEEPLRAAARAEFLAQIRVADAAHGLAVQLEAEVEARLPATPMCPEDLARLRARRPPPPPEDPLAAVTRAYEEGVRRTYAIAEKYKGYKRSATAMSAAGIKGYLCPQCQQWFTWCPGSYPHECPAEARP